MGSICAKEAKAVKASDDNPISNDLKIKATKSSKKNKKCDSSSKLNVGGSEEKSNLVNGNSNEAASTTLTLLIPIDDPKSNNNASVVSDEVVVDKKLSFVRRGSKLLFQRRPVVESNNNNNNSGVLQQQQQQQQQAKVNRINSVSNGERGAQVMAGWPSWLAQVAGEAINGWIPRKAEAFEKLEKIGQGTYSSVYKARDLETNQIVALKKVRFANMDPESVRFMAREIIILRRLDHPNVMKLEGLITSRVSASMYLIFDYMDHDLAGLASTPGVKLSEPQIKCYMKQLLNGLEHCHSRGVLHRDIKGSNLLLDHNNNLKIGDFGLANFYGEHQTQPLTSRVVTLWYRAPELLLGLTDYGVTVDMWSVGCILAELFTGKPIMPGRTEVEQLHKIFKLCGSPSEDYWKKSKLPHATIFKPQHPYKRTVAETFKSLPASALALVEKLLAVEPEARGNTSSALQSEFFTTEPFASEPSSLPKYHPRKEIDVKLRAEERKKGKQNESNRGAKESKSVPTPDANAELVTPTQKREDAAGLLVKPLKTATAHSGYTYGMSSVNRNGESVMIGSSRSPLIIRKKELKTQRSFVQRGTAQLTKFSNSVAARDGSHFAIANPRWYEDSLNRNNGRHTDGGWSTRMLVKPKNSTKDKQSTLVSAGGSLDEMLKEHERQIQVAVRKVQADKKTNKADTGFAQAFLAANGRLKISEKQIKT